MILGFTIVLISVAAIAGVLAVVLGLAGRTPSDLTLGAAALVELLLIAQIVIAAIAPGAGNPAQGDYVEFWAYLISALIIPVGAVFWGLLDRTRWSTVIVGVACLAVAVMAYRMHYIWVTPLA